MYKITEVDPETKIALVMQSKKKSLPNIKSGELHLLHMPSYLKLEKGKFLTHDSDCWRTDLLVDDQLETKITVIPILVVFDWYNVLEDDT